MSPSGKQGLIEEYSFGRIVISGKEYTKDIIIIGGKVYPNWFRKRGHFLEKEDLGPILEAEIRTLIIGIGYNSVMRVGEGVREYCREKGIKLIELGSREAVDKVNELMGEGVAAGIHLTC
jgi:hypothetical protein